jgi:probable rRNA maturation factor
MAKVNFFVEDIPFELANPITVSRWIQKVVKAEKYSLENLNYIFCSDEYLRQINIEYLNHKTFTDIITFSTSDQQGTIEGDIFISIERVRENSEKFGQEFRDELHRVIVHGALHLLGYGDKTPDEKVRMRQKEDAYLSLRK